MECFIISKLEAMGESYDSLKPFLKEYLFQIEQIVSQKANRQLNAVEILQNDGFSASSISEDIKCSRTTLYNHNSLLKRYILYSKVMYDEMNPLFDNAKLKEKISRLNEQIYQMEFRDISVELLKLENKELLGIIKDKQVESDRLKSRVYELSSELHKMKIDNAMPKGPSTITQIN